MSKRANELNASFGYVVKYRIGSKKKLTEEGDFIDCIHFRVVNPDDGTVVATGVLTADDIMKHCLFKTGIQKT